LANSSVLTLFGRSSTGTVRTRDRSASGTADCDTAGSSSGDFAGPLPRALLPSEGSMILGKD
jgi:hypothetical protein